MLENFKTVLREVNDEADRVKADLERDVDKLLQSLTISKARHVKHIDHAADTLRLHFTPLQSAIIRSQVYATIDFTSHISVSLYIGLNVINPLKCVVASDGYI